MTIKAFPYDSQVERYEVDGTPVYDRAIDSSIYRELFLKYFTEGVFPNPSTSFQVMANSTQGALVKTGFALIRGVSISMDEDYTIKFDNADSQDRIDRVILRHDDTISVRYPSIKVLKGTPAGSPQPPEITRDETIWDMVLADVLIKANSSAVVQENITDRRLDSDLCGIVTSAIKFVDTSTLYQQIQSDLTSFKTIEESNFKEWSEEQEAAFTKWFEAIKEQFGDDAAGSLQLQINEEKARNDKQDAEDDKIKMAMCAGYLPNTGTEYDGLSSDYGIEVAGIKGRTERLTSNGYQLFDSSKIASKSVGGAILTNNGDGSFGIYNSDSITQEKTLSERFQTEYKADSSIIRKGILKLAVTETCPRFYVNVGYKINGIDKTIQLSYKSPYTNITDEVLDNLGNIYIGFVGGKGDTIKQGNIKPMLYYDGDGTWEPYTGGKPAPSPEYPLEIKSFYRPTFISNGANLFDASKIPMKTINGATITNNGDGSFTVSGSGRMTANGFNTATLNHEYCKKILRPGKIKAVLDTETFPLFYVQINSGDKYFQIGQNRLEFEIPESWMKDITMTYGFYGNTSEDIKPGTVRPMFTQTDCEEWTPFNHSEKETDLELRSLPNGVCDEIVDGYLIRRVGITVFDGSSDEDWVLQTDYESNFPYHYQFSIAEPKLKNGGSTFCDKAVRLETFPTMGNDLTIATGNKLNLYIPRTYLSDKRVEDFKEWLESNQLTILYELATPTRTKIDKISLDSFYPYTSAWNDSEVKAEIDWHTNTYRGTQVFYGIEEPTEEVKKKMKEGDIYVKIEE